METAVDCATDDDACLDFLIGHDRQGSWFVVETHGLAGGYFRSELDAFKFVLADFRCRPKRIEVLADAVEPFGGTCIEVANRCRRPSQRRDKADRPAG